MLPGLDHMLTQVFRSETGTMFMLCSRRHGLEASVVNLEILDVEILAGYLKLKSYSFRATFCKPPIGEGAEAVRYP
jgi:hypothetical protein